MNTDERPLTADDIVGILIHRANQMGSHLSVHGINTNWDGMIAHLGGMYQDVVRAKEIMTGMPTPPHAEQPASGAGAPN